MATASYLSHSSIILQWNLFTGFLSTVKSRAVVCSTIQFTSIVGVVLTETWYQPRHATIHKSCFSFDTEQQYWTVTVQY